MKYDKFIFDCDGVILNSNKIKKEAFQKILSQYSVNLVKLYNQSLVSRNGYSRHQKFAHFSEVILKLKGKEYDTKLSQLLRDYSNLVVSKLINCQIPSSLKFGFSNFMSLRQVFIVSAGDEKELKKVFEERGLNNFVDKTNIYGSPKTKQENISNLYSENKILNTERVLLIGDSAYDYEVATEFNFDFLFVSDWTADHSFLRFVSENKISRINNLNCLEDHLKSLL